MKKQMQKGFTLIELMIVVAIIGILAAIALPAYQNYTLRTKYSEGPVVMGAGKIAVEEYYATNGELPAAASVATSVVNMTGAHVSGVTWNGSLLEASYTVLDDTVTMTPDTSGNNITWSIACTGSIPDSQCPSDGN